MLMSLTTRLCPTWPDNSWGTTSVVAIPIPFLSKSCTTLTGQTPFARKFSGVKSENSLLYASEGSGSNQNGNRKEAGGWPVQALLGRGFLHEPRSLPRTTPPSHRGADVRLFPACKNESRFVLSIKAEPVSTKLGTGA